jgi:hypothetical protein
MSMPCAVRGADDRVALLEGDLAPSILILKTFRHLSSPWFRSLEFQDSGLHEHVGYVRPGFGAEVGRAACGPTQ